MENNTHEKTYDDTKAYDKMIRDDFIQEIKHEMEENGYPLETAVSLAFETCELYDSELRSEAYEEYRKKNKTLNTEKKWGVTVKETITMPTQVMARSSQEAEDKAKEWYRKLKIKEKGSLETYEVYEIEELRD